MSQATGSLIAALVMTTCCACAPWHLRSPELQFDESAKSPLATPRLAPDSVALEICMARVPADDPEFNNVLWQEIDEQHIPPALRARLAKNGLRAGRVVGRVPAAVQKLLDENPPQTLSTGLTMKTITAEPAFESEWRQQRSGEPAQIAISELAPRWTLFTVNEQGGVCGETYFQPQGFWSVVSQAHGDGRVRLALAPELQHGEARLNATASDGLMFLRPGRPRKTYDELKFEAVLSPGDLIVVGMLPDRPLTLGHYFFTTGAHRDQQKLLLIRLAQSQYDDLFQPPSGAGQVTPAETSNEAL